MYLPFDNAVFGKNSIRITLQSDKVPMAELFSSFPSDDTITVFFECRKSLSVSKVIIYILRDKDSHEEAIVAQNDYSTNDYDKWIIKIDPKSLCLPDDYGLFYYHFVITCFDGEYTISQDEWGESDSFVVNSEPSVLSRWQLSFYSPDTKSPKWVENSIMYQIFPDRFAIGKGSPKKENAILINDWYGGQVEYASDKNGHIKNNTFFGGTLFGVIEKLDYLQSLGVNIIYLNPIFESSSNHKYDTGDYSKVDSMFGSNEAFEKLIKECEKRGIRVILDGVFNHTGDDSKYFNKYENYDSTGAYQDKNSEYNWYKFKKWPDEYESWWGVPSLPAVDSENEKWRTFMLGKNGIVANWTKKGIAGWRLDVADELSEGFIEELRNCVKEQNPEALIIGEVWEDASNKISYSKRRHYFNGKELDSVMNYPLRNAIISYLINEDADLLFACEKILYSHYPKFVSDSLMNILGTHDTERILTVLGGSPDGCSSNDVMAHSHLPSEIREKAKKLLKMAYSILATLPGIPCIYYGDEAGMEGYGDPFCRRPFPWGREDCDLLSHYRSIGKIRRSENLFANGYYRCVLHSGAMFAFERFDSENSILIIANASDCVFEYELENKYRSLQNGKNYKNKASLEPYSVTILKKVNAKR